MLQKFFVFYWYVHIVFYGHTSQSCC
jgi:hypothetical protein